MCGQAEVDCPLALRGNPGVFARLWFAGGAPRRFVRCSCRVFLALRGCPGIFASGVSVALARGRIGGVTVRGGSGFVRSVMGCRWAGSVVSPSASGLRCQAQVAVGCHCPCVAAAGDGGWRRPAVAGCASVVGCPPPLLWSRGAWHGPCILSLAGGMDGLPRSSRAPGQQDAGTVRQRGRRGGGVLGRWGAGAPGRRSAGMLVRWGGRAVGRRSAGAAGGRSGWAFRQWGGGATGRRGATAAERQNAGAVERQSSAALECRSSRVPRQWGTGVSARWGAGAVGHRGAGAAECRCGGVLGWWGAGVPGWRSAGIVKCRGSGVVGCASNGAPERASTGVLQCWSGVFAGECFIKNKTHIVFLGLFAAECLPQIVFCGLLSVVHSFATGRLPRIGRLLLSAGSPQGPLLRSDPFLAI